MTTSNVPNGDDDAVAAFLCGTLGRVAAPATAPCVACGEERPYVAPDAPAPPPPERPRWRWWSRRVDPSRCRCGAA